MDSGPGCGLEPAGLLDVSYSTSACKSFFDGMFPCLSNSASLSSLHNRKYGEKRGVKLKLRCAFLLRNPKQEDLLPRTCRISSW